MTAGAAALAAACGSKPGEVADDGSVTVKHVFGETKIPAPPKRVVSAGLTEQDDLLAVGVVPIAVTDWFGGEPFGVWPWAQPKLGGAQPVVLNLADGVQVEQIASLQPDLIVATNAGLDQDTYTKLAADRADDRAVRPGRVLRAVEGPGHHDRPGGVQARRDAGAHRRRRGASSPPQARTTRSSPARRCCCCEGTTRDGRVRVATPGWRTDFLTQMGFAIADTGGESIPRDRMAAVLGAADVLIWTTESDEEQAALLADPTSHQLNGERNVFTGKELAGAIAFASPLSYPLVADQLPAGIAKATGLTRCPGDRHQHRDRTPRFRDRRARPTIRRWSRCSPGWC